MMHVDVLNDSLSATRKSVQITPEGEKEAGQRLSHQNLFSVGSGEKASGFALFQNHNVGPACKSTVVDPSRLFENT